ncbi:MAG: large repetitive protein, partial [Mycobacterium sp.]|nr:large repetitive protein [Mycobacterium sp.]
MMKYGNFVGRVGALAVALGVGSAIAAPAGIAWANPDTTSDSPSADGQGVDGNTDATDPSADSAPSQDGQPGRTDASSLGTTTSPTTDADKGSSETVEVAPGVTVSSSGGAQSSTHDTVSNPAEPTDGTAGQA